MAVAKSPISKETFRFFQQLSRNNHKQWMDANRDRYRACVVEPFRRLFEQLCPSVLELDNEFDTCGRTGANFSRINRDIRFANDKTPYKPQMYLKFERASPGGVETGQLYVGISKDSVTIGFRIYSGGKRKDSTLAVVAQPRVEASPTWVAKQKKRLSRRYHSYWYNTMKGEWTKHEGWPTNLEDWKKIQAWIVRKKLKPEDATRAIFPREVLKVFKELYPLLKFTSIRE
jgi:uncharacterized protein (TIGR02453 family)